MRGGDQKLNKASGCWEGKADNAPKTKQSKNTMPHPKQNTPHSSNHGDASQVSLRRHFSSSISLFSYFSYQFLLRN
jgi:hypothetical protein